MTRPLSLFRVIVRAFQKDLLLGLLFIPLYSAAEVSLAPLLSALLQLFFADTPRVPVSQLVPKNLQILVDFGQTLDRKDLAFAIPLVVVLVGFVKMLSGFASTYFLERAGHNVARVLRYEFLRGFLSTTGEVLDERNKDETANQLFADTALLQGFLSRGGISVFRDALLLIFILVAMFWLAPRLMLMSLILIVPSVLVLRKIFSTIHYYARESLKRQVDISTRILQTKRGLLTIFAQRLQRREQYDLALLANNYYLFIKRSFLLRTGFRPTIELIALFGLAWLADYRLSGDAVQMATYSSLLILAAFSFRPFKNIAQIISQAAEVRAVFERLNSEWKRLLGTKNEINKTELLSAKAQVQDCVTLKNVSYVCAEKTIVSQMSLSLPYGSQTIFFGESGAGKSTALRLIAGLLTPTSGQIETDQNFLMATQDAYLFRGSVRDNIVYTHESKPHSDDSLSELLLQLGLVHSLSGVQFLKEKRLGFLGDGLSGGEKARVSLARALYAEPDLLLLDEPTANLDQKTSRLFWEAVAKWRKGDSRRTVVAISHLLDELNYFDLCYVFVNGEIVSSGKPSDVLRETQLR